jgi:dihydrofolate reductase
VEQLDHRQRDRGRVAAAAGLLDELRLLLHPIVVGDGSRLFQDGGEQIPLELVGSQAFSTGVVLLVYQPAAT